MPVPTSISDLSTTADNNSPTGSDNPIDGDNHLRAHAAFIAQLLERVGGVEGETLDRNVSPMDYGATGDGTTDDTSSVLQALRSGLPVDGAERVYAVTGILSVSSASGHSFGGIRRLRLKQLAPTTAECKTLRVTSFDDKTIERVEVNRNGGETAGAIGTFAGMWVESCDRVIVTRCTVYGGGPGNGIVVTGCENPTVTLNTSRDMTHNVSASDDVIQGIWVNNCTNPIVFGNKVLNLVGNGTVRYTRGIAYTGTDGAISYGNMVDGVDQGYDWTGSVGNTNFQHYGNTAQDCGTYGHKWASSFRAGKVFGNTALRCGYVGFEVSGPSESGLDLPRDLDFSDNQAIDTGSNGIWSASSPKGFRVQQGAFNTDYPRAIHFKRCKVIDTQGSPTTISGFYTDIAPIQRPTTDYDQADGITCEDCEVIGLSSSPSLWFVGIHWATASIIGSSTASLADSTWGLVDFTASDVYDPSALHNTGSNSELLNIKESGLYMVSGQVSFAANSTGLRKARIAVNGAAADLPEASQAAHPTAATFVPISGPVMLLSGFTVGLQAWQSSGGSLNVDRSASWLSVVKVN